jgi:demethylmenaquinone methyltransferase/2-methoxy-6-polyprenyl-1,4-benzoquinol methylase
MPEGIQNLFSEVPDRYELINHIITLGLDRRWRCKAADRASACGGKKWVDVCTGTGEMAFTLLARAADGMSVKAVDFSAPMLRKAMENPLASGVQFVESQANSLPFDNDEFDLLTISFATRNINTSENHLLECLEEFHRVLKPGGRFINLETSQPESKLIRTLFHLYVRNVVRTVGGTLSTSKAAYRYLSHTIPKFYVAEALSSIILRAGFSEVTFTKMLYGVAAIHEAVK